MESARFCGAVPGEPPFKQTNGQMRTHYDLVAGWWIKFGFIKEKVAYEKGVECTLHEELYNDGYRG
jgi:NitT/TauT family transport system substrate-binding protein